MTTDTLSAREFARLAPVSAGAAHNENPGPSASLAETHISWVLLMPDRCSR